MGDTMALIKCPKCGLDLSDDCIFVWKCNKCGKAVKLNLAKLYKVLELKKQNAEKLLLKCSACGYPLDDGNEKIVCKCFACGSVSGGNLEYFTSDNLKDKIIEETLIHIDDTIIENVDSTNLLHCPKCLKRILIYGCVILGGIVILANITRRFKLDVDSQKTEGSYVGQTEMDSLEETEESVVTEVPDAEIDIDETKIAEEFSTQDEESIKLNRQILQDMTELYEEGKYIEALFDSKDAVEFVDGWEEIKGLINVIIDSSNMEYYEEQIENAFEEYDYDTIMLLSEYSNMPFNEEQIKCMTFLKTVQGDYTAYSEKLDNIRAVNIKGFSVFLDGEEYDVEYGVSETSQQGMFSLENGYSIHANATEGNIALFNSEGKFKTYVTIEGRKNFDEYWTDRKKINQEKRQKKEEEYKKNDPQIGMTTEEVLKSNWGEPSKKNIDTYEWGIKEQWVYSNNRYIYFTDGVVTSISTSE